MKSKFFITSSSCKSVKGLTRSVIIDYLRNDLYFISNEYYDLLQSLERKKISDIFDLIEKDSQNSFNDFITFLTTKELGFLIDTPDQYPIISDKRSDIFPVRDAIIEIDEETFEQLNFTSVIQQLQGLFCNEIQIRLLSDFNADFVDSFLNIIGQYDINYVELHLTFNNKVDDNLLFEFVKKHSVLCNVFIYNSPNYIVEEYLLKTEAYYPTQIGKAYYLKYSFDNGNCCGIITNENLSYEHVNQHNELKKFNGCLYKKVSIDKFGNIKNCPSINKIFGNIKNDSISRIIDEDDFKKLGKINKDEIKICKDCEFRYNCTDCRAFLSDSDDLYSKPLKCGYNPATCEWEDWSSNSLKDKQIIKIS
ncbi:grasp-with-spasm system SPASM domain peptide maturase [uncultured Flavobacterium sp.]|uniref:grasp-with-spasm system SPASM domain peptide maturase n=1 Tax=uncultured Flavobacterium sp. TaxID=165435 RepID=UPI002591E5C0|nr:grasp-with-spasm system SPASM domain peptide maturase [uncultured Flavobacterium sp.]